MVVLDPQLQKDCISLGYMQNSQLLLLNNAKVPWFILVPDTEVEELYLLAPEEFEVVTNELKQVSAFVHAHFSVEKLNVAAIGNKVRQLHIHIVGRHSEDFCWPDVVWGASGGEPYRVKQIEQINSLARKHLNLHD